MMTVVVIRGLGLWTNQVAYHWKRMGLGIASAGSLALVAVAMPSIASAAEVNLYSERKEALIRPVLDQFEAETGITVNLITGKASQLHQRLLAEGRNSPADVLITVDAGNLYRAKVAGLLRPIESEILNALIPARYRDPDGTWYGIGRRARVLVYARDRVAESDLSTYEDLADPKWRGRIAVRSSSNIYNQSLIASMIEAHGVAETETWARGFVANFARKPKGGDTDQIRSVAAGEADVAIANSYYYGRLAASDEADDQALVAATGLFFPNQEGRGTHVNVSGAGVTASAAHEAEAIALLEFMVGDKGQALLAELNHEFPIRDDVAQSAIVSAWGPFKADPLPLDALGINNAEAVRLADRAGWR